METLEQPEMLRPPINRALKQLDRSLFSKTIPLSAIKVSDLRQIAKLKQDLRRDLYFVDRRKYVVSLPQENDGWPGKALLLRPEIKADDDLTWSPLVSELVKTEQVKVVPYSLSLDYDYWDYYQIMCSILPDEAGENIPGSFILAGHVAQLNLREQFWPYKNIIAQVLMDKHVEIRTVINKVDTVGSSDPFRTFDYEVLAGEDDLNVTVKDNGCTFCFDFSKVYWNSRLNTEHARLVSLFKPGQAVCDVMAGVGPFAVPAGKNGCFVMANDLNPHGFAGLEDAIRRNKVGPYVTAYQEDGHAFIQTATNRLLHERKEVDVTPTAPRRSRQDPSMRNRPRQIVYRPPVFSHYVLNLPASAMSFLPSFIGIYATYERLFEPHSEQKSPLVHVYCFSKQDDDAEAGREIAAEISKQLGFEMTAGESAEDGEGRVEITDVRLVAPKKRYFCASFRLPREVAFRKKEE